MTTPCCPCRHAAPHPAAGTDPPATALWPRAPSGWRPCACVGPLRTGAGLVAVVHGTFPVPGGAAMLATRLGAVSRLARLRYWSARRERWQPLVTAACALRAPDRAARRPDFTAEELTAGATLYVHQQDSSLGDMLHRLHVVRHDATGLVLRAENVAPVRRLGLTVIPAGGYRLAQGVWPMGGGLWRYYATLVLGGAGGALAAARAEPFRHRLEALYRGAAGRESPEHNREDGNA